MARLTVNVDHVATLRQARLGDEPDPLVAAQIVTLAGADGITVHLREDRRHIQDRDLKLIRDTVNNHLNLEMAATEEMMKTALEVRPDLITLVPERRKELTTEGGLDVVLQLPFLSDYISRLKGSGLRVSLFVDADLHQVEGSQKAGADCVEVHTGPYCDFTPQERQRELARIVEAARAARGLALEVHAGHGINYQTIRELRTVSEIEEFAIGHSIISRAVYVGLAQAVQEMVRLIKVGY